MQREGARYLSLVSGKQSPSGTCSILLSCCNVFHTLVLHPPLVQHSREINQSAFVNSSSVGIRVS